MCPSGFVLYVHRTVCPGSRGLCAVWDLRSVPAPLSGGSGTLLKGVLLNPQCRGWVGRWRPIAACLPPFDLTLSCCGEKAVRTSCVSILGFLQIRSSF